MVIRPRLHGHVSAHRMRSEPMSALQQLLDVRAALAAHERMAAGRVYVHLADDAERAARPVRPIDADEHDARAKERERGARRRAALRSRQQTHALRVKLGMAGV
jgi:hypothetical protein